MRRQAVCSRQAGLCLLGTGELAFKSQTDRAICDLVSALNRDLPRPTTEWLQTGHRHSPSHCRLIEKCAALWMPARGMREKKGKRRKKKRLGIVCVSVRVGVRETEQEISWKILTIVHWKLLNHLWAENHLRVYFLKVIGSSQRKWDNLPIIFVVLTQFKALEKKSEATQLKCR